MDLVDLISLIDARYNISGDAHFSTQEKLDLIWQGCQILARETFFIERRYTTTTVAGTREYDLPTQTIAVKRITYDGYKLEPINMREDDALTYFDEDITTQGSPRYYYVWGNVVFLRPIPDEAKTLRIWSVSEPQRLTTTLATLEIPSQYHPDLAYFVLQHLTAKENNFNLSQYYGNLWSQCLARAIKFERMKQRRDTYPVVLNMDGLQDLPRFE